MYLSSHDNRDRNSPLIDLNHRLSSVGVPHLINESCIANFHSELIRHLEPSSAYFWLLYSRITEAALLCAGQYADNCEYSAAGDLLANPRRVQVSSKDSSVAELKKRHGSISSQFAPQEVCPWAFRNTFFARMNLHIEQPALLPLMANTMRQSGVFRESYLDSIHQRMKKIADTIAFLLAWSLDNVIELHKRMASATHETQRFIKCNLCCFSTTAFEVLGSELSCLERNRPSTGAFFNKGCSRLVHLTYEGSGNDQIVTQNERA